jgi:putative FmdB family regulatory protein
LRAASANAAEGGTVPTYEYACTDCADRTEVVQKFSDDPLTVCTSCGGRLRKVYSPVGIVFKGSGFYRTDSRAAQKDSEPAKAAANGSDAKKSGADSGSSASSGDKPAKSDKKAAEKVSSSGSSSSPSSSSSSSSSSGSKVA